MSPFAGYKDFDDCVLKNKDKGDPEAYCATIMRKVEDPKEAMTVDGFESPELKKESLADRVEQLVERLKNDN